MQATSLNKEILALMV